MPTPSDFAELEREGWQRVAGRYEQAWSGLTRPFISHLLDALPLEPGTRLLDVACGPGYVAEAARARGADPIGVDFSEEMVRLARARNPRIEFRTGDAQALAFPNAAFDAVAMSFGALHLPDPEAAFAEARRVLRPGGWFGFTAWASAEQSPGARLVDEALRAHADLSVPVPQGRDDLPLGDPARCQALLESLGFDPASFVFRTVTVAWQVPTASFVFESELQAGVRTAALLAAQSAGVLAAIRSRMEAGMSPYANPTGFAVPYAAHVIAVATPAGT